jgi:hypothetical protein
MAHCASIEMLLTFFVAAYWGIAQAEELCAIVWL